MSLSPFCDIASFEEKIEPNKDFTLSEGITLLGRNPVSSGSSGKDGSPLKMATVTELAPTFADAIVALRLEDRASQVGCVTDSNQVWVMLNGTEGNPNFILPVIYKETPVEVPPFAIIVVEALEGTDRMFIQATDPTMGKLRIRTSDQVSELNDDFIRAKSAH